MEGSAVFFFFGYLLLNFFFCPCSGPRPPRRLLPWFSQETWLNHRPVLPHGTHFELRQFYVLHFLGIWLLCFLSGSYEMFKDVLVCKKPHLCSLYFHMCKLHFRINTKMFSGINLCAVFKYHCSLYSYWIYFKYSFWCEAIIWDYSEFLVDCRRFLISRSQIILFYF